jgi:hypothetical protein
MGMLVLAGMVALCPQSAHGALAHDPLEFESPGSATHDHGDCDREVVHTHDLRLSCAPDELASHLFAGYAHLEARHPAPALFRAPALRPGPEPSRNPAVCLKTVCLLL